MSGIYVQIMLLFVYTTTPNGFVISICRYFKLSWNTAARSQSNYRNFSCSSIKSGKMVKSLELFFESYNKFFRSFFFCFRRILFNLGGRFAVHYEKCFVPALLWSIDHLFNNFESGKKNIVLEKSLEKVLNFGSKNLYEHWMGYEGNAMP